MPIIPIIWALPCCSTKVPQQGRAFRVTR